MLGLRFNAGEKEAWYLEETFFRESDEMQINKNKCHHYVLCVEFEGLLIIPLHMNGVHTGS